MNLTTHLVCAPDDLPDTASVAQWLVRPGQHVEADMPLLRLHDAGATETVMAPLAGLLTAHCVDVGDVLSANELLAMIEAEEKPLQTHWPIPIDDAQDVLSVAACSLAYTPSATEAPAATEVIALCAALGVAPDEIPHSGELTLAAVHQHVRGELRLLGAIRDMLNRRSP